MSEFETTKANLQRMIRAMTLTYHCVELLQSDFDTICNDEVINSMDVEELNRNIEALVGDCGQKITDCSNYSTELFSKIKFALPQEQSSKNQQIHALIDQFQTSAELNMFSTSTGAAVEYENIDIVTEEEDLWAERVSPKDLENVIDNLSVKEEVIKDLQFESTIYGIETETNWTVSSQKMIRNIDKISGEKFSVSCSSGAFHMINYGGCLLAFFDNNTITIYPEFVQHKGALKCDLQEKVSPSYMNSYDAFGRNARMTGEGLLIFLQLQVVDRKNKSYKLSTIQFAGLLAAIGPKKASDVLELPPYEVQLYPELDTVQDFCLCGRDSVYLLRTLGTSNEIVTARSTRSGLKIWGSSAKYQPKEGDQIKCIGADHRSLLVATSLEGLSYLELLTLGLKRLHRIQTHRYSRPILQIEPVTFSKTHLFLCFHFAGEVSIYTVVHRKLHACKKTRYDHHNHTPSVLVRGQDISIWGNNTQKLSLTL